MDMTLRLPIIKHLVFRDLYLNRKSGLIFTGVLVGLLSLFGAMAMMDSGPTDGNFHLTWYGIYLFGFGLFHTGGVFTEFSQTSTRQDYLLLPASNLEKWLSRWLRTLPLYLIGYTLIYWIASWIMNLICFIAFGEIHSVFNPIQTEIMDMWMIFIVAHAILMIGAIHFNKNATIKTALTLLILLTAISFIGSVTAWALFQSLVEDSSNQSSFTFNLSEHTEWTIGQTGKVILWFILIPLFWWISFLKLNEKEV